MKKTFALPVLLALVGGCAQAPYWTLTDDANRVLKSTSFEMTVPAGWTRTTTADTWEQVKVDDKPQTLLLEQVTASRDGVALHAITVDSPLSRYRVPDDQEEDQAPTCCRSRPPIFTFPSCASATASSASG